MLKQARKLRKAFANLAQIDFFPSQAQRQVDMALQDLESSANRALAPDEPHAVQGAIPRLFVTDYQARPWATRRRPWVGRLAFAWLIPRFIASPARFLWLESPAISPLYPPGFAFVGATFHHI